MSREGQYDSCKEDLLSSVALLYQNQKGIISWKTIEETLRNEGLNIEQDVRIAKILLKLSQMKPNQSHQDVELTLHDFMLLVSEEVDLISQALLHSLAIPGFIDFCCQMKEIYDNVKDNTDGKIKRQGGLQNIDENEWCVSIVSVNGQEKSLGAKPFFTLNELCGPLIYGLVIDLLGEECVKQMAADAPKNAPDTRNKSCDMLNEDDPDASWFMSDIASILICSKIKSQKIDSWSEPMKHDYVLSYLKGLCCGEELRFSNAIYSVTKDSDCSLNAVAHFIKAFVKCKSEFSHIDSGLDLLFQLRSMEVTTDSLAKIGAVLANGGNSPYDNQRFLSSDAVSAVLNTMYSAGLGKTSPIFAIQCGLPAVCNDSGAMLVVIPGVLGMGLYSPKVECRCSIRGYNFAKDLIENNGFHPYHKLDKQVYLGSDGKLIKKEINFESDSQYPIFLAASQGDIESIRRYVNNGLDIENLVDSTGQTLLHVASCHGQLDLVKYIFCKSPNLLFTRDLWCRLPSEYAEKLGHSQVVQYLTTLESATQSSRLIDHLEHEISVE